MFKRKLRMAHNVEDIADAFDAMALSTPEEMAEFYVKTMDARTGDPYNSPILTIEKACKRPSERGAMLLLGHRGCGKSTELNDMLLRLEREGRLVEIIQCEDHLPLENNPRFSDLLILMGEALIDMALKTGANITEETKDQIQRFWDPIIEKREKEKIEAVDIGAEYKASLPEFLHPIIKLAFWIKSDWKYNDTVRETSERQVRINFDDWRKILRKLSDAITEKRKKQPVLIFEGLDHLEDLEEARELFFRHPEKLTDVSFPVIYTFPIALFYDKDFALIQHHFQRVVVFPMLKLETIDGAPYDEGVERIEAIVKRRAVDGLIDPDALKDMIKKTGGSLRDLFKVIRQAAERASFRGDRLGNPNETVTPEDAKRALTELKSDLGRRIEGDEHKFLAEICLGKRKEIENREMLLDMLQVRAALEYNGERWVNVHPLIADYLEELGYIKRKEDGSGWEAGEQMTKA